jgi:hypothetical protein
VSVAVPPQAPALVGPHIAKTHAARFDTWFPLEDLPIPTAIKPDIAAIATGVSATMLAAFSQSPGASALLAGLTDPTVLPFYDCLRESTNPAVRSLLASPGGYGGLPRDQRVPLFAFLFEATCGSATAQMAMQLRELYLSGIWDLPLAVPLTGIQSPTVFMEQTAIYAKRHAPAIPPSRLRYDPARKRIVHADGPIDCLVVGSGPGGATVAHELWRAGQRVVLVEKGPFVVWGSMDTRSYPRLMFQGNRAATSDNGIVIRSGETLGGGSTVNIDLAFSPLEATVQARIDAWRQRGLIDARYYTPERIAAAYQWVREVIQTRELSQSELNRDNLVLWDGAKVFGVDPSLYHLNRFPEFESPSPVDDKRDAARQLLVPALTDPANPLSVIPDADVGQVLFAPILDGRNVRATGVTVTMTVPWTEYGNTVVDPCRLGIAPGTVVTIDAQSVVLSAGTIGTTRILLNTARREPAVANPFGIVVAFRGTLPPAESDPDSLLDWLQDFFAEPTTCTSGPNRVPGRVHSGFFEATTSIIEPIQTLVAGYQPSAANPVYVTGHSKGGPMASIGAYILSQNLGVPVAPPVITFASPRPGDINFAGGFQRVLSQTRFENDRDIVPLLPPSTVFIDLVVAIVQLIPFVGSKLAILFGSAETWNYMPVGAMQFITSTFQIISNESVEAQTWDVAKEFGEDAWAEDFSSFGAAHSLLLGHGYNAGICGASRWTPAPSVRSRERRRSKGPGGRGQHAGTRPSWGLVLARVFSVDTLECPGCGSRRQVIAVVMTRAR